MERLKRIKKETEFNHFHFPETGKFALAFNLNKDDFDWLIEQVENIEKLKKLQEKTARNLRNCRCKLTDIKTILNS